jgi:hypothetical protein
MVHISFILLLLDNQSNQYLDKEFLQISLHLFPQEYASLKFLCNHMMMGEYDNPHFLNSIVYTTVMQCKQMNQLNYGYKLSN